MLLIHTELDYPGFAELRVASADATRSEGRELHELLLTYNADTGGHPDILRPRYVVDSDVLDGLHQAALDWQTSFPQHRMSDGARIADLFRTADGIPNYGAWVWRLTPAVHARMVVIETVLAALHEFKPDTVIVAGLPRQQAWTRDIAIRTIAQSGRDVEIHPEEALLPTAAKGAYSRYISRREAELGKRWDGVQKSLDSRHQTNVARLALRRKNAIDQLQRLLARLDGVEARLPKGTEDFVRPDALRSGATAAELTAGLPTHRIFDLVRLAVDTGKAWRQTQTRLRLDTAAKGLRDAMAFYDDEVAKEAAGEPDETLRAEAERALESIAEVGADGTSDDDLSGVDLAAWLRDVASARNALRSRAADLRRQARIAAMLEALATRLDGTLERIRSVRDVFVESDAWHDDFASEVDATLDDYAARITSASASDHALPDLVEIYTEARAYQRALARKARAIKLRYAIATETEEAGHQLDMLTAAIDDVETLGSATALISRARALRTEGMELLDSQSQTSGDADAFDSRSAEWKRLRELVVQTKLLRMLLRQRQRLSTETARAATLLESTTNAVDRDNLKEIVDIGTQSGAHDDSLETMDALRMAVGAVQSALTDIFHLKRELAETRTRAEAAP